MSLPQPHITTTDSLKGNHGFTCDECHERKPIVFGLSSGRKVCPDCQRAAGDEPLVTEAE